MKDSNDHIGKRLVAKENIKKHMLIRPKLSQCLPYSSMVRRIEQIQRTQEDWEAFLIGL